MNLKHLYIVACVIIGLSNFVFVKAQNSSIELNFDFRNGLQSWQADFSDYPPNNDEFYELKAEMRTLPSEILASGTGFYFHGNNHSDDLFMFMKRRLTAADGIIAGQRYQIYFNIVFASNAQNGCFAGENVILKAGATSNEPLSIVSNDGNRRMNVNIGNQIRGGSAASFMGDITNGMRCNLDFDPFVSVQRNHLHTTEVTATSDGQLWLLIGTDSGFEGPTTLYYQRIEVRLVPLGMPAPAVPFLITEESSGRGIMLDSVTLMRDPLPLKTAHNFSLDQRGRVMLFATGTNLQPGEDGSIVSAQVEDVYGSTFPVTVEYVGKVPLVADITQIIIRMPDQLLSQRMWVSISMRGATSNRVPVIVISPPPS